MVSPLYGPGVIGGWLLGLLSVYISLTLNPPGRMGGGIAIDFVATLAFPVIAASNAHYAMWHYDIDTFKTATIVRDMFVLVYPLITAASLQWDHQQRMVCIWAAIIPCYIFRALPSEASFLVHLHPDFVFQWRPLLYVCISVNAISAVALYTKFDWTVSRPPLYFLSVVLICVLPSYDAWNVVSDLRALDSVDSRLGWRLVPVTPYKILDLDQAVALGIGVSALLLNIHDVWRARRLESETFGFSGSYYLPGSKGARLR